MNRCRKYSISGVLWLLLCVLSIGSTNAQIQAGQTITLSVGNVSTDTYVWELYIPTPNLDFAKQTGNCPVSKATFVAGNTGNVVQVQALVAGDYYYKVTAQAKNNCGTNFKIGKFHVIDNLSPIGNEDVLDLTKVIHEAPSKTLGSRIVYRFAVTNNGTEVLTSVKLSDPKIGVFDKPLPDLQPKTSVDITIAYDIQQSDIDLGKIVNSAYVTAQKPSGNMLKDISDNNTPSTDEDKDGEKGNDPTILVLRSIEANPDRVLYTNKNGGLVPNFSVLDNDTLEGHSSVNSSNVEIETIQDDSVGQITINTDGTLSIAPNTPFKTYQLTYKICDKVSSICSTAILVVEVLQDCELTIFNAMSVNADGQNDILYIKNIECYPDNILRIFNRWGVEVFNTEGYDNVNKVFEGISNGRISINKLKKLPEGTYYVVIEYKDFNGEIQRKGTWIYLKTTN